jgi:putative transposase
MSHSYSRLLVHLIFSTKNRQPLITDNIREELHAYLIGILRNLESPSIRLNSTDDHIHILFLQSKNKALENIVEEIKRGSSKWIKTKGPEFSDFYWQTGYAAFSVGQKGIDNVVAYISNQQEHHKSLSYIDEIKDMFQKLGLDFDEKHFFD